MQEDETPTIASVHNAASLISIARSVQEDHEAQWFPKVHRSTPMPNAKPNHKSDVVAGCSVLRASDSQVLPRMSGAF